MLRLQIVVQSTLFPKKKSPRLEKLSKPPQGASKLASLDNVFAVRTHAVTFFFLRRTCSCRLSSSFSSHLTLDQLVLGNTVLQLNKKPSESPLDDVAVLQSRIDRVSDHCMGLGAHRAFRRWSFGYRTRTRLDLNLCVNDGFFFFMF